MVSHVGSEGPKLVDKLMWGFVLVIIAGAVVGNYYLAHYSLLLRVIGMLVCCGIAVTVALKTALGQSTWLKCLESLQEVRKMHWPTRQETIHTTLAVLAMVCVMGILLWSADFVLLRLVKRLMTGHWGV